jgi:hypothetical protein
VRFRGFDLKRPRKARTKWYAAAREKLHAKGFGPFRKDPLARDPEALLLRGTPIWRTGDQTPRDPDGHPMEFVGQVDAALFSKEIGGTIYLFHAPSHRLVTLVSQRT